MFYIAPVSAPVDVRVDSITNESAVISWHTVDSHFDSKDTITGYQLFIRSSGLEELAQPIPLSYQFTYTLHSLTPATTYLVSVAAVNKVGIGPKSSRIAFTTAGDKLTT